MKWFVIFGLLLSSCSLGKQVVAYRKVNVYGLPLSSTSRFPKYVEHVLESYFLFTIENKNEFIPDLYTCLNTLKLSESNYSQKAINDTNENIRLVFKVMDKNTTELIAIDKGGKQVLFRDKIYVVDQSFADLIAKYFPDTLPSKASELNKKTYRKSQYTPICCRN